jgi:sugar phosphate isomerase/epimerase
MLNRREALRMGAAAAGYALASPAWAQSAPPKELNLDAYSRTLHWLRKPEELAQACHEIGNTTIDLTVRVYPGHVDPERVKTDLPPFVKTLRENGIVVTTMAAEITDANTPHVEAMLDTAASLGIHHHWWRGFTVDSSLPYSKQIESLKPRVAGLALLNEKYGMKAMYHPGGGFSGAFVDLLDLVRNFDPRYISIQYDTGNFQQTNQQVLAQQIRIGGPYIGGFVFKDFVFEKSASGTGNARAGRGGGRGRSSPNGWGSRQVPVGTGVLDLPLIAQTLKQIGFDGPMECQPEWPELGGANNGLDKITISREELISLLKRDYVTVTTALAAAGLV